MQSGLGEAVKNGALSDAKQIFLQYTKAGGVELPGLKSRRLEEAACFQADKHGPEGRRSQRCGHAVRVRTFPTRCGLSSRQKGPERR